MCALVRFTVSRWLFVLSKESEFTRSWTIETDNIDVRSTYMWKWRRFQLLNVLHIWSDESVSELRKYAFVASFVGYRYSWNLGPLKKRHEIYTVSLRKREWRRFKMKKKTITDFFQHIENLVFTPWNNSIHIRNFILDRESERGFNHSPVNNWMNKPINLFYVRQLYGTIWPIFHKIISLSMRLLGSNFKLPAITRLLHFIVRPQSIQAFPQRN